MANGRRGASRRVFVYKVGWWRVLVGPSSHPSRSFIPPPPSTVAHDTAQNTRFSPKRLPFIPSK
jgi:hypothetical protein